MNTKSNGKKIDENSLENSYTEKVKLTELVEVFGLKICNNATYDEVEITEPRTNRLALQLTGFYDHFDSARIQVIGKVEHAYLETMTSENRYNIFSEIVKFDVPALVITRSLKPCDEMVRAFNEVNKPIFMCEDATADFIAEALRWLKVKLAPTITMHGVLVDVYGEGILITGESGIGKSETALELVRRGHRLVSDDNVIVKRVSNSTLVGSSPDITRHFIELRGIGIVNIKEIFGVESVKPTQQIDLVINLSHWDNKVEYERIGLEYSKIEILGNKVDYHNIPIRPGRNVTVVCETAAVNHKARNLGYNAAKELSDKLSKTINKR